MERIENTEKPKFITQDAFPEGSLGHTFAPIIAGRERPWTVLSQSIYRTFREKVNVRTLNKLERSGIATLEQLFFLTPLAIKELGFSLGKGSEKRLRTAVRGFWNRLKISSHQLLAEKVLQLALKLPPTVLTPEKERELIEVVEEVLDSIPEEHRNVIESRFGIKDGMAKTRGEVAQQLNLNPFVISVREGKGIRQLRHPSRSKHFKNFFKNES